MCAYEVCMGVCMSCVCKEREGEGRRGKGRVAAVWCLKM